MIRPMQAATDHARLSGMLRLAQFRNLALLLLVILAPMSAQNAVDLKPSPQQGEWQDRKWERSSISVQILSLTANGATALPIRKSSVRPNSILNNGCEPCRPQEGSM